MKVNVYHRRICMGRIVAAPHKRDYQLVLSWTPINPPDSPEALLEEAVLLTENQGTPWNSVAPCRSTTIGDLVELETDDTRQVFILTGLIKFSPIQFYA